MFKKGDTYAGSKSLTKEEALRSFGKGNTVSAQCISIKLRALSHDLRERVLVTFDDHGFIYDETVEEAELSAKKRTLRWKLFLNHSKALSHKLSKQKMF